MERLQRAVAPDYRVERKLGVGGMGTVYLAHEVTLNRDVAIKVLRLERATAEGAESFHREAQTLASIRHPNVVVIYRPGQGEGLYFYIMELINGPTLENRLESGPLPVVEAVRIGIDVLRGLADVHRLGLVHRDIKPSNIFLLPDRAVLSDFGIARPASSDPSVSSGKGTPDYMAPEQVEGTPVSAQADIYSLGVALYEAVTGRRFHDQPKAKDWSGVPLALTRVLRRAVAEQPAERWPDAAAFRTALERSQAAGWWRIAAVAVGVLAIIAVVVVVRGHSSGSLPQPPPPPSTGPSVRLPTVVLQQIEYQGPGDRRWMADSLVHMVESDLRSHIAFVDSASEPGALIVRARMTVTGGDAGLRLTGGSAGSEYRVPLEQWSALRDSLAYQIALGVWSNRSALAGSLPLRALPHTSEGLLRFLEAEQLVGETQWERADSAYRLAERIDSTCWICSWRITEIGRWLSRGPDPERVRRYTIHADSLPPPYRRLIEAAQLPLRARLDTLRAVTEDSPEIFLGWFQLGDELFHRGPLVGHRRSEAIPAFERAARLRPGFRPAWEHLAWVATAEGDSIEAALALDSLENRSVVPDPFSQEIRALLQVGFAWRFLPAGPARQLTERISSDSAMQRSADFAAGPRMLPTFDAPRGAMALGEILAQTSSRDLQRSGLIAQILGAVALGRVDSARALARRLTEVAPEQQLEIFSDELVAAIAAADKGTIANAEALDELRSWTTSADVDSLLHDRAAWMSSLLGSRTPLRANAPTELELLMAADSLATAGYPRAALLLLDPVDVDAFARHDQLYRAVVHLRSAAWRAQIGDIEGARAELIWYEHLHLSGLPMGLPQAAEVDWAFGTLARWRLARLLDRSSGRRAQRGEACAAYAAVVRNWAGAPAPYGARADFARTRARVLKCASTR